MPAKRPSMQELIRRRSRSGFVGRRDELTWFRENFTHTPEDEAHHFLFHIHGNAGVGKTSLVRQLEHTAREHQALTAYVDEAVNGVPDAMAAISAQFAQQGRPLRGFDKLLTTYRERRYEAESASGAALATPDPADARTEPGSGPPPSPGSMVLAQAGLVGLGMIPGVGAFTGAVDPAHLAQSADRLRAVLSARFNTQKDVQLVLSPLETLTPVFLADLDEAASGAPWVTLFFDTYERTGPLLDTWLRDLMTSERYGTLPANVVVTLAGQRRLDAACWADYMEFVGEMPLEPFTEEEARRLLSNKGVTDERVVEVILKLSGRLPVLVSTLSENQPTAPDEVGDPSGPAIERFLKWEPDSVRRSAALAGALPRRLDEDVFRATVEEAAAGLFGWLRGLPFVGERDGRVQYHDVVRAPMLRLQRRQSPQRWREQHQRLAAFFGGRREELEGSLRRDDPWGDESWHELRLAESYHLLCADPHGALPDVLRDAVHACVVAASVGRTWARLLVEAGEDGDADAVRRWGQHLREALGDDADGVPNALGLLLRKADLGIAERVAAYTERGRLARVSRDLEASLTDYDRALELELDYVRALGGRSRTYAALGRWQEALDDAARGLELAPGKTWLLGNKAEALLLLGRVDEALVDFQNYVEASPQSVWGHNYLGECHRRKGDFDQALAAFEKSEELDPDNAWLFARRGTALRDAGRLEEAVIAFEESLRRDPRMPWSAWLLGETCARLGDVDKAIEAYGQALASDPEYGWAHRNRGRLYRDRGELDRAEADFRRAAELLPEPAQCIGELGLTYGHAVRFEEALTEFDRALALAPEMVWLISYRGQIRLHVGHLEAAADDLARVVEQRQGKAWYRRWLAETYLLLGRDDDAWAVSKASGQDTDRAEQLHYICAKQHRAAGRYDLAREELDRALELAPTDGYIRFDDCLLTTATEGVAGARDRWGEFTVTFPDSGAYTWATSHAAYLAVAHAALGAWDEADRQLSVCLDGRPYWELLAQTVLALDFLTECPGADSERLAALRDRAGQVRDDLFPGTGTD